MQYKVLIIFYNLTFIHNPHDYSPNIAPYHKKISTDKSVSADSLWIKKKNYGKTLFLPQITRVAILTVNHQVKKSIFFIFRIFFNSETTIFGINHRTTVSITTYRKCGGSYFVCKFKCFIFCQRGFIYLFHKFHFFKYVDIKKIYSDRIT